MATAPPGVSRLQALEAILLNPELYRLAEEIPFPDPERGGRMRAYPNFAYLLYEALISVYRSARQVEADSPMRSCGFRRANGEQDVPGRPRDAPAR